MALFPARALIQGIEQMYAPRLSIGSVTEHGYGLNHYGSARIVSGKISGCGCQEE
ncbi:MAG: hypothetical protein ACQER4_09250 [Bacteroidota bacterium]